MAYPISDSGAEEIREDPRRPWIDPVLTTHASLSALTRFQYPQQPYVRGDSLITGGQPIPCSQGFCP